MDGKVAVISGGTGALGVALVRGFLAAGYRVATFSRRPGSTLALDLAAEPDEDRLWWRAVDAGQPDQLKRFVSEVGDRFGRLDTLVNNAGLGRFGLFALAPLADIEDSLRVNVAASMTLARLCVPLMLPRASGSIVNVSSVNAVRGHAGVAIYSATKAALDGFTRALARELGPRNIRVNSVAPGYFESEMTAGLSDRQMGKLVRATPLGRLGTAGEVADAVLFLVSERAAFITGQTLVVDGGVTC